MLCKKLLILSSYFPPEPEIAAARLRNIAKQLLHLGWELYCVTNTDPGYAYEQDPVLRDIILYSAGRTQRCIPPGADAQKAAGIPGILRRLALPAWFRRPVKSVLRVLRRAVWVRKASLLSLRAIKRHGIGVMLATMPGIETAAAGARVKKRLPDLRFVCEYRDIISDSMIYRRMQSGFENLFVRRTELRILPHADRFIFLTEGIRRGIAQYKALNPAVSTGIVLTNGYDPECYPPSVPTPIQRDMLVINHIGHLYGGRSALPIAKAAAQLMSENPHAARFLRLCFYGKADAEEIRGLQQIRNSFRFDNLVVSGPVSHDHALFLMCTSDVNLVITHQTGSEYAIPGKVFEYIGAGKPILAVTGDPLLVELIQNERLGWVCPHETESLKRCLREILERWLTHSIPRIEAPEDFNILHIAEQLDRYLA